MNATAADSDIQAQARDWALRVFGERMPDERLRSFREWLEADPRHAEAYEEAERLMLALSQAAALAAPVRARRRSWIWAAAALPVAACLVVGVGVGTRPVVVDSGRATRTVSLRDGSTAILAPETRVRQSRWLDNRRYVLERGQALFDVKHADRKPFRVQVDDTAVTVLGTRFDVRRSASGEVGVAVQRGRVAVRRQTGGPPFEAILTQGDVVTLDKTGARRDHLSDASLIDSWRRGRLSYASARIADVAADINRFSRLRVIADPAVADARLTASFRIDQAGAFVANLPALMAVEVKTRPDGALLITPSRDSPPMQR